MKAHSTTCNIPKSRPLCGQDFRDLRHLIKANGDEKYSARRFAEELGFSESKLEFIEIGERAITPPDVAAYKRVARIFIDCMRYAERVDEQTATWLVDALERHAASLTPRDRKRLKKIVEGHFEKNN